VFLAYHLNGSYPMERVEQAVNRIEAYIESNREQFDVDTYYSVWLADEAYTRLYLKPKEEAAVPAAEVMRRISEGLPEIIIGKPSFQFEQGARVRRRSRCSSPGNPPSGLRRSRTRWRGACRACPASKPCAPKPAPATRKYR